MSALLRTATSEGEARRLATLIDARVRGEGGGEGGANAAFSQNASRDSLSAALLGRAARPSVRHPFQSLDELLEIPGVDEALLSRVAPMLTVDGDGRINRRAAPAAVLAAAAGSLVDRPTRLLCIARGWQRGEALTREIQAVYDVADDGLRLVRWREQGR
jgi:type II secretory pathway component PulK